MKKTKTNTSKAQLTVEDLNGLAATVDASDLQNVTGGMPPPDPPRPVPMYGIPAPSKIVVLR